MSALCMNHVNLLWWAGLCAKCKWCFLFPPGVSESPDSRRPQLSWWYRHIQGGSSWLNTLGIPPPPSPWHHHLHPHLSPPPPNLSTGVFLPLAEPSGSAMSSAYSSSPPHLPAAASFLVSQPTPSHYTQEPSTEAPSRSFISVITSQQACGSPSQHPLTLAMVGERMANPWGIDED